MDDCIAESLALESTTFENILSRPIASTSSGTFSESSEFGEEGEVEGNDDGEDVELDIAQPLSPKDAEKTSHSSTSANKAD